MVAVSQPRTGRLVEVTATVARATSARAGRAVISSRGKVLQRSATTKTTTATGALTRTSRSRVARTPATVSPARGRAAMVPLARASGAPGRSRKFATSGTTIATTALTRLAAASAPTAPRAPALPARTPATAHAEPKHVAVGSGAHAKAARARRPKTAMAATMTATVVSTRASPAHAAPTPATVRPARRPVARDRGERALARSLLKPSPVTIATTTATALPTMAFYDPAVPTPATASAELRLADRVIGGRASAKLRQQVKSATAVGTTTVMAASMRVAFALMAPRVRAAPTPATVHAAPRRVVTASGVRAKADRVRSPKTATIATTTATATSMKA